MEPVLKTRLAGVLVAWAALNGAVAVAMGALAAHALAGDPSAAGLLETASRYQMWHALAIVAALAVPVRWTSAAAGAFALGLLCFPGALYLTAFDRLAPLQALAPVGGLAFILGWLVLLAGAMVRVLRP